MSMWRGKISAILHSTGIVVLAFLLGMTAVFAQEERSTILTVSVSDANGAVVVGAQVFLRGPSGTNRTVTSESGEYRIALFPGVYDLEIEPGLGFGTLKRGPFRLREGKRYALDFEVYAREISVEKYDDNKSYVYDDVPFGEMQFQDVVLSNSEIKTGKVAFGKSTRKHKTIVYTTPLLGTSSDSKRRPRTAFTFNLFSIEADSIEINLRNHIITAKGDPLIEENGKRTQKAGTIKLFVKGEQVIIMN